ncbi:hypothetical protein AVEN_115368-1 [Araneus ventricosus]|uniref:Uncharacterized protein n=1 Tax=Araneus ventricosus TaxID=182803 RepID=A0A4Y1ZY95_ARAVE|nr:hypothetical protein AVEN_115368-1 [Araneus ventricosus]
MATLSLPIRTGRSMLFPQSTAGTPPESISALALPSLPFSPSPLFATSQPMLILPLERTVVSEPTRTSQLEMKYQRVFLGRRSLPAFFAKGFVVLLLAGYWMVNIPK